MNICTNLCFSVRAADLPGAETLEEEIQSEAPHHSSEENTHQRQTLNFLTTPQLNTKKRLLWIKKKQNKTLNSIQYMNINKHTPS